MSGSVKEEKLIIDLPSLQILFLLSHFIDDTLLPYIFICVYFNLILFLGATEFETLSSILDTLLLPELEKLEKFSANDVQVDKEELKCADKIAKDVLLDLDSKSYLYLTTLVVKRVLKLKLISKEM